MWFAKEGWKGHSLETQLATLSLSLPIYTEVWCVGEHY